MSEIQQVTEQIEVILEDQSVPKNVRERLSGAMKALTEDSEIRTKVDRAMQFLDEVGDDVNIQPYTRTQIWHIVSILEKC